MPCSCLQLPLTGNPSVILQDRRKALVLTQGLTSASPIPNFTLNFIETINGDIIGSVDVVNPNGAEKTLYVSAFIDQGAVDGNGQSIWADQNIGVDPSTLPAGVSADTEFLTGYTLFDANGAIAGSAGIFPDPDGVSIWVAGYGYTSGAFQKYNTSTLVLTDTWQFPFNAATPYAIFDGTAVFFQDSIGNLYAFSNNSALNGDSSAAQRLHKIDKTTHAEIAALGYDQQHPPPGAYPQVNWIYGARDWALFTHSGDDYVAIVSTFAATAFAHVINLTTMTLVGSFSFAPLDIGNQCAGVWVDSDNNVWFGIATQSDTNLLLYKWVPLSVSGLEGSDPKLVVNLIWTIPGSEYQSGTPAVNNAFFFRYVAATNAVIVAGFGTSPFPDNGNAGDVAEISLTDGSQVAFVSAATSPALLFTGLVDAVLAAFRVSKCFGTDNTNLAIQGDTLDSTSPTQRGGILNVINPGTLAIETSVNIVELVTNTVGSQTSGGGYTDRGIWNDITDFAVGDIVTASDALRYLALTTSGPSDPMGIGVKDPADFTSGRPVNWENWVGLPGFHQETNNDPRSPEFTPFMGMLYFPGSAPYLISTQEFVGGPLILTPLNATKGGGGSQTLKYGRTILPFSERLTAAAAVFPCIFIASPQGAQMVHTSVANRSALALEYAQLVLVYDLLKRQDIPNQEPTLDTDVCCALCIVKRLKATIESMMASGDVGVQLQNMQIVVANSLATLIRVNANEETESQSTDGEIGPED